MLVAPFKAIFHLLLLPEKNEKKISLKYKKTEQGRLAIVALGCSESEQYCVEPSSVEQNFFCKIH